MPSIEEWVECRAANGNSLLLRKCNRYRANRGLPPLDKPGGVGTVIEMPMPALLAPDGPSAGLGDSVAKVLWNSGLKTRAENIIKWWWRTNNCGCAERQRKLNAAVPYPAWVRRTVFEWFRRWI